MSATSEFSFRSRKESLRRFRDENFDLLIVGGGITGAAAARDAVSRGLKVALVEKRDFAWGTSSRSSKLIHGGLRYLENMEFALVFEALAERAFLLKTAPHMVRPLPFYFPVYQGDIHGKGILGLGMWLYDLLALFRTPGFHKSLSKKKFLADIPFLKSEGLKGGFRYFDASMWDDVLTVETLRSAHAGGAAIANYVEAKEPLWEEGRVSGFRVRDLESDSGEIELRASRVVICAGPWTDLMGGKLSPEWHQWLMPSKGVHLIFDLKRIPVPGALVMSHPEDGRIAFVMPRPDLGAGVTIVGTTDGPSPAVPDSVDIESSDVDYLMRLLDRYFPNLKLTTSDILSGYVGIRPLMGPVAEPGSGGKVLQQLSREHHIGDGPGGTVLVAGGKYTTHRKMAEQILDHVLKSWKKDAALKKAPELPPGIKPSQTKIAVNPRATPEALEACRSEMKAKGVQIPEELFSRYGAEAADILELSKMNPSGSGLQDPPGFPQLAAQLRHALKNEMVLHLEDFYLRRIPLYAARADQGLPWAGELVRVWAEERGLSAEEQKAELSRLQAELQRRSRWKDDLSARAQA